jgi:predicted YcjX-like family ATPase
MHLPPYARWSQQILERFAKSPPPNTRLDVTTISLIGKPRVSSMTIADLRPTNERFGMVNFVRDTTILNAKRQWWRWRAVAHFNVQENNHGTIKTGWVWNEVAGAIKKRAGPAAAGERVKGAAKAK